MRDNKDTATILTFEKTYKKKTPGEVYSGPIPKARPKPKPREVPSVKNQK